jgi:Sulfotransferase family
MKNTQKKYVGFVDHADAGEVSGWAMAIDTVEPVTVRIMTEAKEFLIKAEKYREKIKIKGIHNTGECGFHLIYDADRFGGVVSVGIMGDHKELQKSRKKQIFFMHIAKAAGTSVNSYFRNHLGDNKCIFHIESHKAWNEKKLKNFDSYDFLSGHISLNEFRKNFNSDNFNLITFVRNPIDHLISHLVWVRHLSEPENFQRLQNHPDYVKKISKKLNGIHFSNHDQLRKFIENMNDFERMLFDNRQTRYFSKVMKEKAVDRQDCEYAIKSFKKFDLIGITEQYESSMALVAKYFGWIFKSEDIKKENVSKHDYGIDRESEAFYETVFPLIQYDIDLYINAVKLFNKNLV